MTDKQKKVFRIIIITLTIVLVIESVYFAISYYNKRKNTTYYTVVNSAVLNDEKNYIGAGYTDFKHSKINEYKEGYNKATLYEVENGKTIKEVPLKLGLNSLYNDITKTKDGYVAVGRIEMNKKQQEEKMTEGLIVKYDKNFKQVWRKNVSILEKTELYKVKVDKDGNLIIAGSSIYAEGYVGNHTTGGGILLKYSNDGKQLLKVNNGGPYNGAFNDLIIEDNSYVVVGLGRANSGIIIKYEKNGKKIWSSSYGYTDKKGINAIAKQNDNYITATTKVIDPKKKEESSAAIVVFDKNGNKIEDVKYSDNKITVFCDIETKDNNIIVSGYTGKINNNALESDAIALKYDKNLYEKENKKLKKEKNEVYSNIYIKDNNIYLLGYTNSKLKEYETNGYDYYPIITKYNLDLK